MGKLLELTESGLYCPEGDFHIDPWRPVARAIITHAHSDHARIGSRNYLTTPEGAGVLRLRVTGDWVTEQGYAPPQITTLPYGQTRNINGVSVSLHPAGHLLGSAQVRVEHGGEIWVVSGDYKTQVDATCTPFEPVRCHTFITESTFGLPIYRWRPQAEIFADINSWWRANQDQGRTSFLYAYALGKAQRILAGLDPEIGPILVHGSVARLNHAYAEADIALPPSQYADDEAAKSTRGRAIVIAPPSAANTPTYLRKFGPTSHAFASGWMTIRGARRRRAVDRGFVLSDHADWPGLIDAIRATGAETIGVTHGYTAVMVRWLRENGWNAWGLETRFTGEEQDEE
ncbi:MAG: ligase-associated DNA damage response exonuclease [Caldilineaceae bacterium]|nr:ligase-associated DNA damage response exonuclease [Caldilineaceae bacterium]MCB9156012.1 ligase-associated DNA damage response exonuclease [Caldilineaceae bacterium]